MKTKTKIKKYIRKNSGKLIIIGLITIIGVAANINLILLKPTVSLAEVNYPKREVKQEEKPEVIAREVLSETVRTVTAYNAGDVNQCDDSPCISANTENICEALKQGQKRCAANFVPFGTDLLIRSPKTGWSFQCKVTDRMNKRFPNRVDIAMTMDEKDRAIKFGAQELIVSILK